MAPLQSEPMSTITPEPTRIATLPGDTTHIEHLEARLRAAQLASDVQALSALISDALIFAGPDGRLMSKSDDIEAHRGGHVRFLSHEPLDLQVQRLTADVAVAYLRARLSVAVVGAVHDGTFLYTRVWQREADGVWRVRGGQVMQAGV